MHHAKERETLVRTYFFACHCIINFVPQSLYEKKPIKSLLHLGAQYLAFEFASFCSLHINTSTMESERGVLFCVQTVVDIRIHCKLYGPTSNHCMLKAAGKSFSRLRQSSSSSTALRRGEGNV